MNTVTIALEEYNELLETRKDFVEGLVKSGYFMNDEWTRGGKVMYVDSRFMYTLANKLGVEKNNDIPKAIDDAIEEIANRRAVQISNHDYDWQIETRNMTIKLLVSSVVALLAILFLALIIKIA